MKCYICQRAKYTTKYLLGESKPMLTNKIKDILAIDYFEPLPRALGNMKYVFVVVDSFSKYVKLYTV